MHQHLHMVQLFIHILHHHPQHILAALRKLLFILDGKGAEIPHQQKGKGKRDQTQEGPNNLVGDFQPIPPAFHTHSPLRQRWDSTLQFYSFEGFH